MNGGGHDTVKAQHLLEAFGRYLATAAMTGDGRTDRSCSLALNTRQRMYYVLRRVPSQTHMRCEEKQR